MRRAVHAVVVAYRDAGAVESCLAPLAGAADVTVVDNSLSADVRAVALEFGAEYIDSGGNVGFAAGVNRALRRILSGEPRDVLLLNPDAVLAAAELDALRAYLHRAENRRVAAVGPLLVGAGGGAQRTEWPFPSPARAWLEAVGLGRVPARRTFVVGAVLLVRWEALVEVGLFDERFFLYAEEADWQRRAARAGWRSAVDRAAVAVHEGGGSSADPRRREVLFHAGQETYIRKWYGVLGWRLYRTAAWLGACVRAVVLAGDRRRVAARRAALYARGPCRVAADGRR